MSVPVRKKIRLERERGEEAGTIPPNAEHREHISPEAGPRTSATVEREIVFNESSSNSDPGRGTDRLYIKQITMKGFRTFKNTTITFHQGLNLIAGQNGSGKSSILKAVELCLSAMHNSFRKSALYKAGVLKTPVVYPNKPQPVVMLKIIFGDERAPPQGLPGCPVVGEHHICVDAHFTKGSRRLKCKFKFNGKHVTFDRLHECLRVIGVTTQTIQFIRQDQPFASDEFESATLMEQFASLLEHASRRHVQVWVRIVRESIPQALEKAARASERAETILKLLQEASAIRTRYSALKKRKRRLELKLNGYDLDVLKNRMVQLQSDLTQVAESYWQAVATLEESIEQLEKLQWEFNSVQLLHNDECDYLQVQLVRQLQDQLNALNSALRDKLAYRKQLAADVAEWHLLENRIRPLEVQIIDADRELQGAESEVRDREVIIANLTARKNAILRALTNRSPEERLESEKTEEERLTREIHALEERVSEREEETKNLKLAREAKAEELERATIELTTIQEQLERCILTMGETRQGRDELLEEYERIAAEGIKLSRNRTPPALEEAREQLVVAMGPAASVHLHIDYIRGHLYSNKDSDHFCLPILDLIDVEPMYRRAVCAAESLVRAFVVPGADVAGRLVNILANMDLEETEIRLITLDVYDHKLAEKSRVPPPGAKPLADYVQLTNLEDFGAKRQDQIREMISAELRHFFVLDSTVYDAENIEEALHIFDHKLNSKLTFVNIHGDIITRQGIMAGSHPPFHDVITVYEQFCHCNNAELQYIDRAARMEDSRKCIFSKKSAVSTNLATQEKTFAELRRHYTALFHRKAVLEKELRIEDQIFHMCRMRQERTENELRTRRRFLDEKRLLSENEPRQQSVEQNRTELYRIVETLRQLEIELASENKRRASAHQVLASLRADLAELQGRLVRLYDEWLVYPTVLVDNASYELACLQRGIVGARCKLREYQEELDALSRVVDHSSDHQGRLSEASGLVDVQTAWVTEIERRMNTMRANLTELSGQYSYLGGDPDDIANAAAGGEDDECEAIATEAEIRRQLDAVREQLSEMPDGLSLLDEGLPEMLVERLQKYRAFHDDLRYVQETGLNEIELRLISTRRAVERTALRGIENEMQAIFMTIVPQGQVMLVPIYSNQDEADTKVEGDLISLQIQARFSPSEPLRGSDMFSGGQRAIMSMVLVLAKSRINRQRVLLLDEVDASLDELHCAKYTELLKALSMNTQVIVVSHRVDPDRFISANLVHKVIRHHGTSLVDSEKPIKTRKDELQIKFPRTSAYPAQGGPVTA